MAEHAIQALGQGSLQIGHRPAGLHTQLVKGVLGVDELALCQGGQGWSAFERHIVRYPYILTQLTSRHELE